MLRVIVVDDEALARQGMHRLLSAYASVQLIGEAGSVKAAADLIRNEKPDAVFLDIEMHGDNGFDLLRAIDDPPKIIFVTAHSQYAVKSYEFLGRGLPFKTGQSEAAGNRFGKTGRGIAESTAGWHVTTPGWNTAPEQSRKRRSSGSPPSRPSAQKVTIRESGPTRCRPFCPDCRWARSKRCCRIPLRPAGTIADYQHGTFELG